MTESSDFSASQPLPVDGAREGKDSRGLENNARPGKSNRLLYVLIGGLVLLAIAGLALLAVYFYLSRQPAAPAAQANPLDTVRGADAAPDLAVLGLAGEPDDRVIRAALDAGEMETAYAELAHSVLLPDSTRAGHWLLLAGRYGGAGEPVDAARAALAYELALDQAALSPGLGDVTRAGISMQVAKGLSALDGKPGAGGTGTIARLALKQAENIARYSLTLLPGQRRDALQQVVQGYRTLGDKESAAALQGQVAAASAGPGAKLPPPADLLAQVRGSVVLPPAVAEAMVVRQQAAAILAAQWLPASEDARRELTAALGAALVSEDTARAAFYDTMGDLSQADQLAMLHDRVNWLNTRYRVARRAYGTSLVPDWEGQADAIAQELSAAYTDLINGYGRELDTLPVGDAAVGRLQLLQQALLWTRLGLFPDNAEPTLRTQLLDASQQLWTQRGSAGLIIVVQDIGPQHYYLLSGTSAAQDAAPTATQ